MSTPLSHIVAGAPAKDIRRSHNPDDIKVFRRLGYTSAEPLGRGMEAAAYTLPNNMVGKVWGSRTFNDVCILQRFYDELANCRLSFATPHIVQVEEVDGHVVSIEQLLPGSPFTDDDRSVEAAGVDCLIAVHAELSTIDVTSSRLLPLVNEQPLSWSDFASVLIDLLERRVDKYGEQMHKAIDHFDDKVAGIKALLRRVPSHSISLIHGDLGGGNVLVDKNLEPVSVLDFGFFTTAGDVCFDASITSGMFDMWSPRAQLRQHQFDTKLREMFGWEQWTLLTYRAAYAVIVANAYDAEGKDGQFWWSTTLLNRPDVHKLLLS